MSEVEKKLKKLADETIWGVNGFRSDTEPTTERVFRALLQVRNETLESVIKICNDCDCGYDHDCCSGDCCQSCCGSRIVRQLKEKVK